MSSLLPITFQRSGFRWKTSSTSTVGRFSTQISSSFVLLPRHGLEPRLCLSGQAGLYVGPFANMLSSHGSAPRSKKSVTMPIPRVNDNDHPSLRRLLKQLQL